MGALRFWPSKIRKKNTLFQKIRKRILAHFLFYECMFGSKIAFWIRLNPALPPGGARIKSNQHRGPFSGVGWRMTLHFVALVGEDVKARLAFAIAQEAVG